MKFYGQNFVLQYLVGKQNTKILHVSCNLMENKTLPLNLVMKNSIVKNVREKMFSVNLLIKKTE